MHLRTTDFDTTGLILIFSHKFDMHVCLCNTTFNKKDNFKNIGHLKFMCMCVMYTHTQIHTQRHTQRHTHTHDVCGD